MPLPPVVIELSAADAASPHAAALVQACSQTVADGECRLGAEERSESRAVAIVTWEADGRRARIEFGLRRDGRSRWATRKLEFEASDPEPERWRAVGLVVGSLVGEAERAAEPAPVAAPAPAPARRPVPSPRRSPTPAPPRSEPRVPTRLWVGVEAMAGPALDDGTWRWGAGASAVYDLPASAVLGAISARYLARGADEREVSMSWVGVSLGLGLRAEPLPGARAEGRVEALLERVEASVVAPRRDGAGRWAPGARLCVGAGPTLGEWGTLLASGEIDATSHGTVVSVQGQKVGRAPPVGGAVALTARVRLF